MRVIGGDDLARQVAALSAELPHHRDPADADGWLSLLRRLYAAGRRDLPLGRLFEGHVDALQIVSRYGSPAQVAAAQAESARGAVMGVWNAEQPGEALRWADGRLTGGKSYASGAGLLTHALVTAEAADGRRLLLVDLRAAPPRIDRGWWRTIGMQRSETHRVRWEDAPLGADACIGAPGDYGREPWFSGGALRFAAVQAGGVAALFDHSRDHLAAAGRAADPIQSARLAELYALAQAAADAVRLAADREAGAPADAWLAHVAAARMRVAEAGDRAIAAAQQAVGLQGLFDEHPLSSVVADLSVYLRQPGPDAQRLRVGAAAAAGLMGPGL